MIRIKGHDIIYIPTKNDITSIHAYINSGTLHESEVECGIAHLLEHILLDSWNKKDYKKEFEKKGIITNAHTLPTYTNYYIIGLTKNIEKMIDYISGIITNPVIEENIEKYRKAVKEELLININNPSWKLNSVFYECILNKGYSWICNYDMHLKNLDNITYFEIVKFYNKWYRSGNIFFTVVSNHPENIVKLYFDKYLNERPLLEYSNNIDTIVLKDKYKLLKDPNNKKTRIKFGFVHNNPSIDDIIYSNLVKDILVGDLYSLFNKVLRIDMKLVYGVILTFDVYKTYIISKVEVNCQHLNVNKLMNEFLNLLKKIKSGNIDDYFINRSKERLHIMDMNNGRNNTEILNLFYTNQYMLLNRFDISQDEYMNFIKNATKEKIVKTIKRLFKNMFVVCETN